MKLIHKLYDCAFEELDEAECYAKLALEYKQTHPDISARLLRLSEEELTQADIINSLINALFEEKKHRDTITERDAVRHEIKQEFFQKARTNAKLTQVAYKT